MTLSSDTSVVERFFRHRIPEEAHRNLPEDKRRTTLTASTWSECDIEARLCHALDIARQTVELFATDGYSDEESPVFSFGPEKPAAETAMLLYAASPFRDRPAISRRIDQLARKLSPLVRSDRVCIDVALHPALGHKFAVPHVLLTRLGFPDDIFDTFLKSCLAAEVADGKDRPPSAVLEKKWISSLWNGGSTDCISHEDLDNSMLRWPLDIIGGMRDDAYAFTHLLMYSSDFGHRIPPLPRSRASLVEDATSLLVRYFDLEDYDVAGEILLTWPFTRAPWSASSVFLFQVLTEIEDQVGILPCGNIKPNRLIRLEGEERTRYALGTAYHTAYVMGFFCAALLRAGRIPPNRVTGDEYAPACLERLLDYVREDQGHWQPKFRVLPFDEQLALTPFILDMTITQSCRAHDYKAVHDILSLAATHQIGYTPLCRQAEQLLHRIGACSTIFELRTETRESTSIR